MVTISYPIGSMYAIYGNIYHQYTPNVSIYIYTSTMDPMGMGNPWTYKVLNDSSWVLRATVSRFLQGFAGRRYDDQRGVQPAGSPFEDHPGGRRCGGQHWVLAISRTQRRPMASQHIGSCVAKGKHGVKVGKKLAIMG